MKKLLKTSLLASAVVLAVGCQGEEPGTPENAVATQLTLETQEQKAAYAIGASVSRYVASTLEQQQALGISLDKELILAGMEAGLNDKSQLSDEEIQKTLQEYDAKLNELAKAKQETDNAKHKQEGASFLEENGQREGVITTDSGLQYEVLEAAEGAKPKADDVVKVHYKGTLIDGTQFDSSYDRGKPAVFPLNRVIPGWTEGVQLMPVGSKYKFYIPYELAYGEQGAGNIPPFSTLIFEVELLDIEQPAQKETATEESAEADAGE